MYGLFARFFCNRSPSGLPKSILSSEADWFASNYLYQHKSVQSSERTVRPLLVLALQGHKKF